MLTTPNYGLKKPEGTDVVNIDDFNGNADIIDTKLKDINTTKAPLDSPGLTGSPTAPTQAAGDNSTKIANTAFVTTAVANKTSVTGNAGTATKLQTARNITLAGDMNGSASFDGSSDITITATAQLQEQKTYAQLATMVTNNQLVPGTQYVLTDYATKYQQPDTLTIKTMSVERLVLTATSTNTFDVVCSSLDYPQDIVYYRFDLNKCEDGTTARNGFITRRIDESPSVMIDAPLDWRKILWVRYLPNQTQYLIGSTLTNYSVWTSGAPTIGVIYKSGNMLLMAYNTSVPTSATDGNVFAVIYNDITVGMLRSDLKVGSTGTQDISLQKSSSYIEYLTFGSGCAQISFEQNPYSGSGSSYSMPNNVFGSNCSGISFGYNCRNNTFGNTCTSITFEGSDRDNTFLHNCNWINFGPNCCSNTFGSSGNSIIFGSSCSFNIFGGGCNTIQLISNCYNNTFGSACWGINFGGNCSNNIFGGACDTNSFECGCYSNKFGNNCCANTFLANCYNNTLGSGCWGNTFGSDSHSNTFLNSCNNNTFGSKCISNYFNSGCSANTFGSNCYNNNFGSNSTSNSFGSNSNANNFGAGCNYNTFGAGCYANVFGDSCGSNTFASYNYGNTFGAGFCNIIVKYMRNKNISAISVLVSKDYTTNIEKRADGYMVYWQINSSNVPVYTVIA